jgi:hypothetical protein
VGGSRSVACDRNFKGVSSKFQRGFIDISKGFLSKFQRVVHRNFKVVLTISVRQVPLVVHPHEEGEGGRYFFDHDGGGEEEGAACFHVKKAAGDAQNVVNMRKMLHKYREGKH